MNFGSMSSIRVDSKYGSSTATSSPVKYVGGGANLNGSLWVAVSVAGAGAGTAGGKSKPCLELYWIATDRNTSWDDVVAGVGRQWEEFSERRPTRWMSSSWRPEGVWRRVPGLMAGAFK